MDYRMPEYISEIEEYFADLQCRSIAEVQVNYRDEVRGNPNNDYYVEWSIEAKPKNPKACPIEILYVRPDCFGFAICTFGNLARQVGLREPSNSEILVAGHEPVRLSVNDLIERCNQIVHTGVSVEYRRLFGRLVSARAYIGGAPLQSTRPWGLGVRSQYEYQAWSAN